MSKEIFINICHSCGMKLYVESEYIDYAPAPIAHRCVFCGQIIPEGTDRFHGTIMAWHNMLYDRERKAKMAIQLIETYGQYVDLIGTV